VLLSHVLTLAVLDLSINAGYSKSRCIILDVFPMVIKIL
jgi:general stress protein CsbA